MSPLLKIPSDRAENVFYASHLLSLSHSSCLEETEMYKGNANPSCNSINYNTQKRLKDEKI